jgi:hypothetical protein
MKCHICGDQYDQADITPSGSCRWCARVERFSAFAASCGLTRFPDPSGERYLYRLNGDIAGKKSECLDFMDDLWNALVRAKGAAGGDLVLG